MRRNRLKKLADMAVCVVVGCFAASCTSNEFYGIQEKAEGLDFPTLSKIAQSKEFIEFQKQTFLSAEEINNIDTTRKVIVDYFNGKPVYCIGNVGSIRLVLDARQKLVELYPEFENTTDDEKDQMLNIAMMNNKSLKKLAERCMPNAVNRTKSINYESHSVKYATSLPGNYELISTSDGGQWQMGGVYTWYTKDNYQTIINDAIIGTESSGNMFGGYIFRDISGTLNVDPSATSSSMSFFYYTGVIADYVPAADFQIRPNNNLNASEADFSVWAVMPTRYHFLYDKNGNSEGYEI